MRREYHRSQIDADQLLGDPMEQFRQWMEEALAAQIMEPNAAVLATASGEGRPSSRTVLLKEYGGDVLFFFTNYQSRKALEITANSYVSFTLLWKELERQIVVDGQAERASRSISESYFAKRPRGSQLSAWASKQGDRVASRKELERRYQEAKERFTGDEIPCPADWGGFKITPHRVEFWQGRPNRLHDRVQYCLVNGVWSKERLSP